MNFADRLIAACTTRDSVVCVGIDPSLDKIPQEILYKPGKLTFDEFAIVKNHVLHGIDIAIRAVQLCLAIGS